MEQKQKTQRDTIITISLEQQQNILDYCCKKDILFTQYQGSLQDNYIVYTDQKFRLGKRKARKYLIMVEKYVNCWSSTIELIMTDKESTVEFYENSLIEEY